MDGPDGRSVALRLRDVEVRPVRGVDERRRWDALMAEHHYLPYRGLFGKSLRQVAVRGETWLALLGWQAGAFKVGVRDAWIGWTREQQFSRLHLIANNSRFAVLDAGRVPNLASRALGLGLLRLSGDMRAAHGHPVLLAETFVDPSRFAGTCYRASNWVPLGRTRGFSREPGGVARWREHGRPKEVYVYELENDAAAALRCGELPGDWRAGSGTLPPPAPELRSLHAFLAGHAGLPQGARAALRPGLLRDDHDRRPAGGLPGGDRVRGVRGADGPGAAGGGRARSSARAGGATRRRRRPPSTTSCRRCRPTRWTGRWARGRASAATGRRRWRWTARTCAAPRSRPGTDAG